MSQNQDHVDRVQAQWRAERPEIDTSPMGVIARLHRIADALRGELLTLYREHGLGADVDPMTGHLREPQFAAEDRSRLAHRDVDTGGRERARCDEPRQAPTDDHHVRRPPGLEGSRRRSRRGTGWSHAQHFVTS